MRTRLLILDEFAYAALFEVISCSYLKSSTILTSHTGVASWGQRLGDPMLAAAMLDRLLHRGIVVAIVGPSYRMRAHQQTHPSTPPCPALRRSTMTQRTS